MLVPLPLAALFTVALPLQAEGPPAATVQAHYLKALVPDPGDRFGSAVSLSGDTAVIGAPREAGSSTGVNGPQTDNGAPNAGAAYVLVRSGPTWVQEAYLKASNVDPDDGFGSAVAVSGDTIVVGALGEDSNFSGVDADGTNNGAPESGAAYVFVRAGTTWSQQAYLKPFNTDFGDNFGWSVAVDGDTVVVGARAEDGAVGGTGADGTSNDAVNAGAVYVFVRSGTTWTQQAYLKPAEPDAVDLFGSAVAIEGDTIVVGAEGEDGGSTVVNGDETDDSLHDSGAAWVFVRTGTTWSQQAYLKALNPQIMDRFGISVALSGDRVAVGAVGEDGASGGLDPDPTSEGASSAGAVYVFERSGTSWAPGTYLKASVPQGADFFGDAVALSGETLLVGAYGEDSPAEGVSAGDPCGQTPGEFDRGAVYLFRLDGGLWRETAWIKASPNDSRDEFGRALALDGDTALAGAPREDGGIGGVDGDASDDTASDAGAVYVLELGVDAPLGVARCFGDGSGTPCPCGNDSANAREGCRHSGPLGMKIRAFGSASIAADDFIAVVTGAPHDNTGIFYVGRTDLSPGNPLYDGLQCAGGDVRRFQGRIQTNGCVSDTGFVAQDPSGVYFQPGLAYLLQYWTRDVAAGPSPCGTGANFSPAFEVVMTP